MLFNKDNNGSRELYELSGIFQAATQYLSIAPEIESATREVAAIAGSAVISKAETLYRKNAPSAAEQIFIDTVRRPIAYLAIGMHSKLSGISHGETGRKNKVDDNEKIAFQWQIDRDDQELRERYLRAPDSMIDYLISNNVEEFISSEANSLIQKSIVKTRQQLEKVYPIEGSWYTFYMLLPLIVEAQEARLVHLAGENKVKELIDNPGADDSFAEASRRSVILRALVTAVERWSLSVFPVAVARQFAPSYQGNREKAAATIQEIDRTLARLKHQTEDAERDVKKALSQYSAPTKMFPDNNPGNKFFTV